ncbi:WYL domain-containing protein [Streptomyces sp. NPDC001728]|uniref:WYL domain-containing protein n=1 Tax=Streptomyces sp. NPDC001728 TaxID=3154396 RepID=UPI0033311E59
MLRQARLNVLTRPSRPSAEEANHASRGHPRRARRQRVRQVTGRTDFHSRLHRDEATVRISARGAARLTGAAARALAATGTPEPDGWTRATLPVESPDHAHAMLLGLGAEAEVLAPDLRARIAVTVRTLAERYV